MAETQVRSPSDANLDFDDATLKVMAETQVRSPSDANLDFDDATLKGKYTFKNILI